MQLPRNIKAAVFWLALTLIIVHEMDAVARHEWRLLPIISMFEDDLARDIFVLLHLPLFAVMFWAVTHPTKKFRIAARSILATLLIVHGGVHYVLSGNALYEFDGMVAAVTIYGAAIAGALFLTMTMFRAE